VYRERWHLRLSDDQSWNECMRVCEDMEKLCASKGWPSQTYWTPTAGR